MAAGVRFGCALADAGYRLTAATTAEPLLATFGSSVRPDFSASKGAIVQLTKSLAQEFAGKGVLVNAVAPGWIETPLVRNLDPQTKAGLLRRVPAARWGESPEVAAIIAFLCSPAASYVTGAVVPVYGGYLIA